MLWFVNYVLLIGSVFSSYCIWIEQYNADWRKLFQCVQLDCEIRDGLLRIDVAFYSKNNKIVY